MSERKGLSHSPHSGSQEFMRRFASTRLFLAFAPAAGSTIMAAPADSHAHYGFVQAAPEGLVLKAIPHGGRFRADWNGSVTAAGGRKPQGRMYAYPSRWRAISSTTPAGT